MGKEHLGESVEQYALRVSSIFTRLLAESKRTAPSTKSPERSAWKRVRIAVFGNGLLPSIRNEQVRKDPVRTLASARERARKHASDNLRGINSTNLYSSCPRR